MTVWVCKNWLFSIRNAAMQHLLLSQRHQKFPDAAPGSKRLMQKLQDFEEDNRLKLEQYL